MKPEDIFKIPKDEDHRFLVEESAKGLSKAEDWVNQIATEFKSQGVEVNPTNLYVAVDALFFWIESDAAKLLLMSEALRLHPEREKLANESVLDGRRQIINTLYQLISGTSPLNAQGLPNYEDKRQNHMWHFIGNLLNQEVIMYQWRVFILPHVSNG